MIEDGILESLAMGEAAREYNGNGSMFNVAESTGEGFGDDPMYEAAKK